MFKTSTSNVRKFAVAVAVAAISISFGACNSDSVTTDPYLPNSCQLTKFALSKDTTVCIGLDTVFFSIDQIRGEIFNADSLPMGAKINKLVPRISVETASVLEIIEPRPGKSDSIHNYIEHPGDSIDFSNGPVRLRIVSADGQATCSYNVRVLVHKSNPDTLVWSRLERAGLPSVFTVVTDQGTAHTADKLYCLTHYDGKYCMATATDPSGVWQYSTPVFSFTPVLYSLTATDKALYILDDKGNLMTSTDGNSWSATGQQWSSIYGAHLNKLLGVANRNGSWKVVTYPEVSENDIPDGFPVSGASQTTTYTFEMSDEPQTVITGGRRADGTLSGVTWGYDGNSWACITRKPLPEALENAVVIPYFTVDLNYNTWKFTERSVLIAMFGRTANGALNDTVYTSSDLGVHWQKADKLLQQAAVIPGRVDARAFNYKQTLHVSRSQANGWVNIPLKRPAAEFVSAPMVTAVKPVSEWECPYIYLFGGYNAEGTFYNTMYRGVIQRFTFIPII